MNLRDYERDSIRRFVQSAADDGYLSGRVLDYGCGKQPYRDIVEAAGAQYWPYDRRGFAANVSGEDIGDLPMHADAMLCTQVVQYVDDVPTLLAQTRNRLSWHRDEDVHRGVTNVRGYLVLTYPTNWPEVEPEDLHRFTKAGMERLLTEAGFTIVRHEMRAAVFDPWIDTAPGKRQGVRGEEFALGYGVICRA